LGFTFKEDCPDTRNTRVIDVIREFNSYGLNPQVADPVADSEEALEHYNITFVPISEINDADCLIITVAHSVFNEINIKNHLKSGGLLVDVKGLYNPDTIKNMGYKYWRL
jgi:UDP-N-acetyl-D-galactosamine dehydrogenase